jgi:hypothetical protein
MIKLSMLVTPSPCDFSPEVLTLPTLLDSTAKSDPTGLLKKVPI